MRLIFEYFLARSKEDWWELMQAHMLQEFHTVERIDFVENVVRGIENRLIGLVPSISYDKLRWRRCLPASPFILGTDQWNFILLEVQSF